MVGRLPLKEDILGSNPSSATKSFLNGKILLLIKLEFEWRTQARNDLGEPGSSKTSAEVY
ncbi:MAG: hypothetical protein UW58_C0003G0031, partial [Candidatus Collierbacteria bacterium GW2011_GWC2_44_30]